MSYREVPENDHIARHVKATLVHDGRVDGGAFLRRSGEASLSVNWLEILANHRDSQLAELRRLSRLRLTRGARFATLRVGDIERRVAETALGLGVSVGVSSDPLPATENYRADPSHAAVTGLPEGHTDEAMLIGDLIAECVLYPLHPARPS